MRPTYDVEVIGIHIVDGDTHKLIVDPGWNVQIKVTSRVFGIDAPEKNTLAGQLVLKVAQGWLGTKEVVGRYRFVSHALDMYGRSIGDLYRPDKTDLTYADFMLAHGLVKPYDGKGKRAPWTSEELAEVVRLCNQLLEAEAV